MTVVYDCTQSTEEQILKPKNIKHLLGEWNDLEKEEAVFIA